MSNHLDKQMPSGPDPDAWLVLRMRSAIDGIYKEYLDKINREIEVATRLLAATTSAQKEAALHEVANSSVDKTLKIIKETRLWLLIFGFGVVTSLGLFSYQAYEKAMQMVETKVNGWLSINEGSPVQEKLEHLRTRTLLDSYMVRGAREMTDQHSRFTSIELSRQELARITMLMKDKSTTDIDFNDAAKVVALSRKGPRFEDDKNVVDVVKEVFGTDFNVRKRYALLTTWGNEPVIEAYAKEILKKGGFEDDLAYAAFMVASRRGATEALSFAVGKIKSFLSATTLNEMQEFECATYLAHIASVDPKNGVISDWLRNQSGRSMKRYPLSVGVIAQSIAEFSKSGLPGQDVGQIAVNALDFAVKSGVLLKASVSGVPSAYFVMSLGNEGHTQQLTHTQSFLDANWLLTGIMRNHTSTVVEFSTYVRALEMHGDDDGRAVAKIVVDVSKGGKFSLLDGSLVSSDETGEPIMVTVEKKNTGSELRIDWRAKNGKYLSGVVGTILVGQQMGFSYSYDKDIVGRIEMHAMDRFFVY